MMKNFLKIFLNELKTVFTDPGTSLIMVGGIFLYGLFYTLPFATDIVRDVPIAVVDFDNSKLSREFVKNLDASEYVSVEYRAGNVKDAEKAYFEDKVKAFVVVPKDFERDIKRGGNSFVSLFNDSAFLISYKQVSTGVITCATALGARLEAGIMMKKGVPAQKAINIKMPLEFVQNPLFNPSGSYMYYIYPLILILVLQQTMLVGGGLLAGTVCEKLRAVKFGRVSSRDVEFLKIFGENPYLTVFAKSCAYAGLYFVYAVIYFLLAAALLDFDPNADILGLFLILIPFLFSTACLAQVLTIFCRQRESSLFILVVTSVPIIFLPGFVWPKENVPFLLQMFTKLIPADGGMNGLVEIWRMGASFAGVFPEFLNLTALSFLYYFLAVKALKSAYKTCGTEVLNS